MINIQKKFFKNFLIFFLTKVKYKNSLNSIPNHPKPTKRSLKHNKEKAKTLSSKFPVAETHPTSLSKQDSTNKNKTTPYRILRLISHIQQTSLENEISKK